MLAHPLAPLLALGVASRLLFVGIAWLAGTHFNAYLDNGAWDRGPAFARHLARWDSGFYMDIAELGYGFREEAWAFHPGYPVLIALVRFVMPFVDWTVAGFLVSTVAFLAALVLLHRLTLVLFEDTDLAWRASVFFAFSPAAFYLSAVYADALFVTIVLGFFITLHRERFVAAALLASLAAFTRPPGILLVGAFGVALLLVWRRKGFPWRGAFAAPVSLILPAAYGAYAWRETGDFFKPASVREKYWHDVGWHSPTEIFAFRADILSLTVVSWIAAGILVAVLAFVAYDVWRYRRETAYPAYAFTCALAVIYLGYSEYHPLMRYLLPVIPLYWALARWTSRPTAFAVVLAGSCLLAAFVTSVFASWGPLY